MSSIVTARLRKNPNKSWDLVFCWTDPDTGGLQQREKSLGVVGRFYAKRGAAEWLKGFQGLPHLKLHPNLRLTSNELARDAEQRYNARVSSIEAHLAKAAAQKRDAWSGVSRAQFDALFARQGRVCAICNRAPSTSKATHLDHCHNTDKIRGVLCASCNKGLGHFRDDPSLARAAARYLETADTGFRVPRKAE